MYPIALLVCLVFLLAGIFNLMAIPLLWMQVLIIVALLVCIFGSWRGNWWGGKL